jgi:hypothetical protein
MIARAALSVVAALLVFPAAASAQTMEELLAEPAPIEEAAADLAYGMCPLFLAGQLPLTGNSMLDRYGLKGPVQKQAKPGFGTMEMVTARLPDGQLDFGGIPGKVCSVVVQGDSRDKALARLHRNMAMTPIPYAADPATSGERGGAKVEAFKANYEGQVHHLQLIRTSSPAVAVVAQLFVTDK